MTEVFPKGNTYFNFNKPRFYEGSNFNPICYLYQVSLLYEILQWRLSQI